MSDNIEQTKRRVRELTLRLINDDLSEREEDLIIEEINRIVPDPEYTDYVFDSEEDYHDEDYTEAEEDRIISETIDKAIERALQYKPIKL